MLLSSDLKKKKGACLITFGIVEANEKKCDVHELRIISSPPHLFDTALVSRTRQMLRSACGPLFAAQC
jgi:hypothetical protein